LLTATWATASSSLLGTPADRLNGGEKPWPRSVLVAAYASVPHSMTAYRLPLPSTVILRAALAVAVVHARSALIGIGVVVWNGSTWHAELQPSPSVLLPSSHCSPSPNWVRPSPQRSTLQL